MRLQKYLINVIKLKAHNLINCDVSIKIVSHSKVDVMAVNCKGVNFAFLQQLQRILAYYLEAENYRFPSAWRDQAMEKRKNTPTIATQPPTQKDCVIIPWHA